MRNTAQRACIWCGPAFVVLVLAGWGLLAGFFPPPSPSDSPDQVAAMFRDGGGWMKLGLVIAMVGAGLLAPWFAATAVQLRRIEGGSVPVWTYTYLMCGAATVIEFLFPLMIWQSAVFRAESSASEILQKLNDLAWLCWLGITSTVILQGVATAVVVFGDKRAKPILPRWYAYLCLWCMMLVSTSSAIVFFKGGPFAWNGIAGFWFALVGICFWVFVTAMLLLRLTARRDIEDDFSSSVSAEVDLRSEIRALSSRVAELESGKSASRERTLKS
ncbi:hypothetical protein AB5J62_24345 [Amycolatopsis sp. cg5]|uniref:hypothetical protein n=1 Tax=Amycolatopsis sp. cg5 TaxID=3238802 RepID=UPI00352348F2